MQWINEQDVITIRSSKNKLELAIRSQSKLEHSETSWEWAKAEKLVLEMSFLF